MRDAPAEKEGEKEGEKGGEKEGEKECEKECEKEGEKGGEKEETTGGVITDGDYEIDSEGSQDVEVNRIFESESDDGE